MLAVVRMIASHRQLINMLEAIPKPLNLAQILWAFRGLGMTYN
jgi:hypothetical protein